MVERSRFLEEQWTMGVSEWLRGIVGNVVPRDAFLERNRGQPEFWVRVFRHMGFRPSNKSIRNFMEMLERGHEGRCGLNREWVALIAADSIAIKKA